MHIYAKIIAFSVAILPCVVADFDIYRVDADVSSGAGIFWQVFPDEPNCSEVMNARFFQDRQDVSGDKLGVRCAGHGCAPNPSPNDIDLLEIHFKNDPLYFWSKLNPSGF
jgi:hypothetical protein